MSNFETEEVAGRELEVVVVPVPFVVAATVLGGAKKEVMLAFALGFFASEVGSSVALRLRDMMIRLGGCLKGI